MDVPLDSETVGRILRRAQEIEASHAVPGDDGVGVSPQALIEAAEEVGIEADAVRDAMTLERFDASRPEPAALDRLVGPSAVVVEHVVPHPVADALQRMESWLTVAYRMRCVRTSDGGVEARPRSGWAAKVGRRTAQLAGEANIKAVDRVRVDARPLATGATSESPKTIIRVVADRNGSRSRRVGVSSTAGVAAAGTVALGVTSGLAALPVLAVPLVGGGYVTARSGRGQADRIELELMRVLAAVDVGEEPVGLVGRAAGAARRAVSEVRQRP